MWHGKLSVIDNNNNKNRSIGWIFTNKIIPMFSVFTKSKKRLMITILFYYFAKCSFFTNIHNNTLFHLYQMTKRDHIVDYILEDKVIWSHSNQLVWNILLSFKLDKLDIFLELKQVSNGKYVSWHDVLFFFA